RVPEELPAAGLAGQAPLGRDDADQQPGRRLGGRRRLLAHVVGVSRPGVAGERRAVSFLPYAVAAWLFVVGLWGVVSSRNLVRTVLSLTVVQSSTYLLLLGVGYRSK